MTTPDDLRARVHALSWYHSIELAPGLVTPGWFDTRPVAEKLPWPDLTGRRCLDVGTFDGFWAFEMERRGGSVVAVDVLDPRGWDWPAGATEEAVAAIGERKQGDGFLLAREALGSQVERLERSVYDLDPQSVGRFDFVYAGSLLLHLRDPVAALGAIRSVCSGGLLLVDAIDLSLTLVHPRRPVAYLDGHARPWWWHPNAAGLARMVTSAGFVIDRGPQRLAMPRGEGQPVPRHRWGAVRHRAGRNAWYIARYGDPHAHVLAHPGVS